MEPPSPPPAPPALQDRLHQAEARIKALQELEKGCQIATLCAALNRLTNAETAKREGLTLKPPIPELSASGKAELKKYRKYHQALRKLRNKWAHEYQNVALDDALEALNSHHRLPFSSRSFTILSVLSPLGLSPWHLAYH